MIKKNIYLILLTVIIISLAQLLMNPYRSWNRTLSLNLGQISEQDVISPVEFSVYKTAEKLQCERKEAEEKVKPVYKISDNITFNAIRNLDVIVRHFDNLKKEDSFDDIKMSLEQKGYKFTISAIKYLSNNENRLRVHNYLSEKLAKVLDIGIYPENYNGSSITVKRKGLVKNYYLFKLYAFDEAKDKIIDGFAGSMGKQAVKSIVDNILAVNIILDRDATQERKQKAVMDVSLTAGKVLRNETIIRKGERVNEEHLQKILSMQRAMKSSQIEQNSQRVILSGMGLLILLFVLMIMFFGLLQFRKSKITKNQSLLLLMLFSFISLITLFISNILRFSSLLIPLSFSTYVVMKLTDRDTAFLYTMFQFVIVSILLNFNYNNPMLLSIASLSILILSQRNTIGLRYLTMAISLIVAFVIFAMGLSLIQMTSIREFTNRLLMGTLSIIISTVLAVILLPYIEIKFKVLTRERLLELLNEENPLLKRIRKEIPGTYHHSLIVGNLAEDAAEAIGANHLLARVGSYYHDLGKLTHPQMFIENNIEEDNLHEKMLPTQSAQIIKNHVLEGIRLGREFGLPDEIIEIIQQHHGTSEIRFFLNKAKEKNLDFDDGEFIYPGPKPSTQEAAIIMIADIVESHSRTLPEINNKIIAQLLEETVNKLIKSGQLNEAPLTISDLRKIMNAMQPILLGVNGPRIEYPEDEN